MSDFETATTTIDEYGVITDQSDGNRVRFAPGDDLSSAPASVVSLAAGLWTSATIDRYNHHQGIMSKLPAALKKDAQGKIVKMAETYRALIASQSAGKLAEYRIKEEIARDPGSASEAELALLSREAKARGTNRTGLIDQINAKSAAYRQIALLIGALEAEAGAAITIIPDDAADIETQILTVLGAAKAQAETAFNEALALINGA